MLAQVSMGGKSGPFLYMWRRCINVHPNQARTVVVILEARWINVGIMKQRASTLDTMEQHPFLKFTIKLN